MPLHPIKGRSSLRDACPHVSQCHQPVRTAYERVLDRRCSRRCPGSSRPGKDVAGTPGGQSRENLRGPNGCLAADWGRPGQRMACDGAVLAMGRAGGRSGSRPWESASRTAGVYRRYGWGVWSERRRPAPCDEYSDVPLGSRRSGHVCCTPAFRPERRSSWHPNLWLLVLPRGSAGNLSLRRIVSH